MLLGLEGVLCMLSHSVCMAASRCGVAAVFNVIGSMGKPCLTDFYAPIHTHVIVSIDGHGADKGSG
jgi:hypothetical protein